jgi:hypothetical protein
MARVTGIGGVFFKSTSDHKQLAAWYRDNLGLALEEWGGAILKWPDDKARGRRHDRLARGRARVAVVQPEHVQLHDQLPGR